jgi:hypothetical protein
MKSPTLERTDGGPDIYTCDNCPWSGPFEELEEIESLWERVDEGGPMPNGECPECGVLAYKEN